MSENSKRIALLIDADNSPAAKIGVIVSELAKYGTANIRRAYGNWKSPSLIRWEEVLHEYAIRPMQQFDYTKGKDATDAAMIIDAMDMLYEHKLDGFGIVSSDSDFTPLVMRLRASGAEVYGFGQEKTPKPFVNACSKFLYLEKLGQETEPDSVNGPASRAIQKPAKVAGASSQSKTAKVSAAKKVDAVVKSATPAARKGTEALKQDTKLVTLLRNSVDATSGDDGWSHLGAVGTQINRQASFDQRNYGYARLGDLIEATDLFDIDMRGSVKYIRDKRVARSNKGVAAVMSPEKSSPVQPPEFPTGGDVPPRQPD